MLGWHATRWDDVSGLARRHRRYRLAERPSRFRHVGRANPTSSPISNIRSVLCCAMLLVLGPSKQDLIRAIR